MRAVNPDNICADMGVLLAADMCAFAHVQHRVRTCYRDEVVMGGVPGPATSPSARASRLAVDAPDSGDMGVAVQSAASWWSDSGCA